ncbi:MAG: serine protease [Planctomycetota bacterium]
MMPIELIAAVRSGVAQVIVERDRERVGSGSAFLVDGGIITNSHNLRKVPYDALAIRFADTDAADPANYIRIVPDDCILAESPEEEKDYAYLKLDEPEFSGRHVFEFCCSDKPLSVGEQVVFLGFPFGMSGMSQLTSHVGHVSSIHNQKDVEIIQIDGSVNGGNSGGPLIDLTTGQVAGIVTRAVTGLIEEQFRNLICALRQNQEVCKRSQGMMTMGFDLAQAIGASYAAMEQISRDLFRSANVGIGYAYSARYARDAVASVRQRTST